MMIDIEKIMSIALIISMVINIQSNGEVCFVYHLNSMMECRLKF